MTLKDYLAETGTRDADFARTIGVSRARLWTWKKRYSRPPTAFARRIERATGGSVTMLDVLAIPRRRRPVVVRR